MVGWVGSSFTCMLMPKGKWVGGWVGGYVDGCFLLLVGGWVGWVGGWVDAFLFSSFLTEGAHGDDVLVHGADQALACMQERGGWVGGWVGGWMKG